MQRTTQGMHRRSTRLQGGMIQVIGQQRDTCELSRKEQPENDVDRFNNHYEKEIINIKNIIFLKISELIQSYALENQIDLILDKNQYLISSDTINISEIILFELNELNIDLNFTLYEN